MMKHSDTGGNIINKKRCPHLFTGTGDLNLSNYALSFLLYIQDGGGREHATSKRKWSLICMRLTQVSELKSRPMSPCNKQPNTATDYRDQTNFGKCVCGGGGGGLAHLLEEAEVQDPVVFSPVFQTRLLFVSACASSCVLFSSA